VVAAPIGPDGPVGAVFCPPAHTVDFPERILTKAKGPMIVLASNGVWLSLLAVVGVLLCGRVSAQAQQFSADLVTTRGDDAAAVPAGKLRVFNGAVRIETPELADGFFLVDGARPAAYFVRAAARVIMDARQSSQLTRIFVQVDPDDPCRQWQALARLAGAADQGDWRCERAGEGAVGGHHTTAYRAVSGAGREIVGWIDAARKFPLRIETEDGATITAGNVRDEPQPAQLFEVPQGFRKFDPETLIQRIKQSDVWVAGEKDFDRAHP
jgi:hypothetical protein